MKLRQLESLLQDVEPFETPKVALEQYPTGPHLAACMLHTAAGHGDIEGRAVVDLGCGCGVLSIAAALLGAGHVVSLSNMLAARTSARTLLRVCALSQTGVDLDADALATAAANASQFEGLELDLINADVTALPRSVWADTVILCASLQRPLAR